METTLQDNNFGAGWYPDPQGAPQNRYWDGARWTEHTAPLDPQALPPEATRPIPIGHPQAPGSSAPQSQASHKAPFWTKTWFKIAAPVTAVIILAAAFSPREDSKKPGDSAAPVAVASTSATPAQAGARPSSTSTTETSSQASTPHTSEPVHTSSPTSGASASDTSSSMTPFTMPNEVGKVLQDAQDHVQAVSGDPMYFSLSEDALGLGRSQILDANWRVCSQSPAPGSTVTADLEVSFDAVKLGESCP